MALEGWGVSVVVVFIFVPLVGQPRAVARRDPGRDSRWLPCTRAGTDSHWHGGTKGYDWHRRKEYDLRRR